MSKRRDIKNVPEEEQVDAFAFASGADRDLKPPPMGRTTISLPEVMLIEVEDMATKNKRSKQGPKSFSAIVRDALNDYLILNT